MLKSGRGKLAAEIGPRIEPDAPGIPVGPRDRCVPVDDNGPETAAVVQEVFAYPEEVVLALRGEREARPDASVNEDVIPDTDGKFEALQEMEML